MPLTDGEFASILSDDAKRINEDLAWTEDEDHSPAFEFRVNVDSMSGWPLLVGEKHKHRWSERYRDKEAYVPTDVAAPVSDPV